MIRYITDHCFNGGVSHEEVAAVAARLAPALARLQKREERLSAALLAMATETADLAAIETLAKNIRAKSKCVVVAGAGGAGLSGRVLTTLKPSALRFHFLDNIDPDTIDDCLALIDVEHCHYLIVSKSGSTVETLGQFFVLFDIAKNKLGEKAAAGRFTVITGAQASPLRDIAKERGIAILDHPADIGGRFSVLANVGLLPAAIAGLDIAALRRGAASVVNELQKISSPEAFAPAFGAAIQYAYLAEGRNISVMLPYSERLAGFSSWYRQGWAESLGKSGKGSTPIRAVGTTDQHSQLQLYLDGPKDKLFHLILLKRAGQGHAISVPARADLDYLKGATTGDIMAAEQKATLETLIKNNCPVRLFEIDSLNEEAMGALLMHFTLEIIFMAELLQVNPFDQPAVEEGKELTRRYLATGNL